MKFNLENRLRRVTSGGGYLPEVDGLRFIAIFTVLYYHMWHFFVSKNAVGVSRENTELLSYFFDLGGQGVQLFFVISGFILGLPFAKQYIGKSTNKINIKRYYLRRLERLEPTYIISLLIFFVIGLLTDTFRNLFPHLIASILYVHNIVFLERSLINGVAWSLEIEVQFYLMAPFLAYYFKIKDISLRRFLLAGFIIMWSFVTNSFRLPFVSLYDYIQYFLCGFLVVDFYLEGFNQHFFKNNAWLGVLLIPLILWIDLEAGGSLRAIYCLATVGLFSFVLFNESFKKIFSNKFLSIVGGMCYSIYLIHYIFISLVGNKVLGVLNSFTDVFALQYIIYFVSVFLVVLLGSSVFFILFEKPFMYKEWYKNIKI